MDADGRPRVVVATREPSDPNRELWWALTGAGGGNFGIVTRYWFRSPGASGADPAALLPRAPESITTFQAEWSWNDIDRRVLPAPGPQPRRSGASGPATPMGPTPASGRCWCCTASSSGRSSSAASARPATPPSGRWTTSSRRSAKGPSRRRNREQARMSWLEFALNPFPDLFTFPPGGVSVKGKDALLKKRFTDRQIDVAYDHLTSADHDVMGGMLGLGELRRRDQPRRARRDRLRPARRDPRHRRQHGLAGSARRGEEPGLGAGVLSRSVRGHRRCARPGRRVRGRVHQPSRPRSRGSDAEHLRRAVARALLPGRLRRACSGSRRAGTRATSFATRCRSGANEAHPSPTRIQRRRGFRGEPSSRRPRL